MHGQNLMDYIHPDDAAVFAAALSSLVNVSCVSSIGKPVSITRLEQKHEGGSDSDPLAA